MNINFFSKDSSLFPFRWFIIIATAIILFITYADATGWRLLNFSDQEEEQNNNSRSGVGYRGYYHK